MDIGSPEDFLTILIDGGDKHLSVCDLNILIHIGDGDSSLKKPGILLNEEKDYSDFAAALLHIPSNANHIHAHGLLGGRDDHQLGTLLESVQFLSDKENIEFTFYDKSNSQKIKVISRGCYEIKYKGIFSTFTFTHQLISIEGDIKYSVNNIALKPLSTHGLSNQSKGSFKITTQESLVIFFNY
jgi:thiamine pyrophosphokinase